MAAEKRDGDDLEEGREAKRRKMNLVYPFSTANNLSITPPFINVGNGLDISDLTLNLRVGNGLYFDNGTLSVVGGTEFKVEQPLANIDGLQTLKYSSPLYVTEAGELTMPTAKNPVKIENNKIALNLSNGLTETADGLTLDLDPVFFPLNNKFMLNCGSPLTKQGDLLSIKVGNGIQLQGDQLECTLTANSPLIRRGTELSLNLGSTIIAGDNGLQIKSLPPLLNDAKGLSLKTGSSLQLEGDSVQVKTKLPISNSAEGLTLQFQPSLILESEKLQVNAVAPLVNTTKGLTLQTGSSLQVDGKSLQVKSMLPLSNAPDGLRLLMGNTLKLDNNNLQVKTVLPLTATQDGLSVKSVAPLISNPNGITLQTGSTLQVLKNNLEVKPLPPLTSGAAGLGLQLNSTLQSTPNGLQVKPVPPLANGVEGLNLQLKAPLQVQDQKLVLSLADYFTIENNKLALKIVKGGGLAVGSQGLSVSLSTMTISSRSDIRAALAGGEPSVLTNTIQREPLGNLQAHLMLMSAAGMTTCTPDDLFKDRYETNYLTTVSGIKFRYQALALGPIKFINLENYTEQGLPIQIPATDFLSDNMSDNLQLRLRSPKSLSTCTTSALVVFQSSQEVTQETCHLKFYTIQSDTFLMFLRERSSRGQLKSVILKSLPVFVYMN
ncbi:fiber protein [Psittacine adenovirus 5]|uniref:Fiber protein n=1 Tax=Psittacine adenovirus 5 TaxID=2499624 RepID=A0A5J6DCX8_9ADEN|nr:fiber protein [Psittacine adenovirus 5]QER78613.1 fiber protein [Psittacine adenovirus 5]